MKHSVNQFVFAGPSFGSASSVHAGAVGAAPASGEVPCGLPEPPDDVLEDEDDEVAPPDEDDEEPLDVSSSRPTIGAAGMLSFETGSNSSVDVAPEHALAKASRGHMHAFGIDWDDTGGKNNGHFAPFSWSSS